MPKDSITLTTPDDWHLHLRDGAALATTAAHSARQFRRAIVMPNLQPPVTTVTAALQYRERILQALPPESRFDPMMTLYLTDATPPTEIERIINEPSLLAVKYYPAGATTNSANGVTAIDKVYAAIARMEELGVPLLVHGEVTDHDVDIFDREAVFIERILSPLLQRFPKLKLVLEHITTADAVEFVLDSGANVAATITVHHLLLERNDLLVGGVRPHYFCLPVLKRRKHRDALVGAAISGNRKFFLGTDSAPHTRQSKESACGCAGIYSAPAALELYAEVFDNAGALDKLEYFASFAGADFYNLPRNNTSVTLTRSPWVLDESFQFGEDVVVPLRAGASIEWKLKD